MVLFLVVVGDQALLLLEQTLALFFQRLSLGVFVVDACNHEVVFIVVGEVGVGCEEILGRNEGQRLVFVAGSRSVRARTGVGVCRGRTCNPDRRRCHG